MWRVETNLKNHINAIFNKGKEDAWRFIGFYGDLATHLTHESWSLIKDLNNRSSLSWLCSGDFNELLSQSKTWWCKLKSSSNAIVSRHTG